jgi:2-polyprenyl-6-hydroxyphenyl methylase/3-demethylubiquinone-9 3-methyltransferase
VSATVIPYWILRDLAADLLWRRNPIARYRDYSRERGMSVVHDWFDWLGGYPFEVARPEGLFDFYSARGFTLVRLRTAGGSMGCNELVFRRE